MERTRDASEHHHAHGERPRLPETGALVDGARAISAVAGAATAGAVISGRLGATLAAVLGLALSVFIAAHERQHRL